MRPIKELTMEHPIRYVPNRQIPRYPWSQMEIGDYFTPPEWVSKYTVAYRAKVATAKFKPKRFSAKTTKGRWEIRRIQ